jgi:hypothetical protein
MKPRRRLLVLCAAVFLFGSNACVFYRSHPPHAHGHPGKKVGHHKHKHPKHHKHHEDEKYEKHGKHHKHHKHDRWCGHQGIVVVK